MKLEHYHILVETKDRCSNCEEELCDRQQKCNKVTCKYFERNTFIHFDAINSIKRIMTSK